MEKDRRPASRAGRFWAGANAKGIPLQAIVATVAVVAATYLAGKLLYRLRDVVLLLLVASFFAVLLNPLVAGLQHRGVRRRGAAVFVVTVLAVLVVGGLAAAFGYPVSRAIAHLAHAMPGYVAQAKNGQGWVGHLVRRYHLAAWVSHNESKLVKFGQDLASPALTVGKGAVSLLAALATLVVLVVLLLLDGPAMMQGILNAMSPSHAERFSRIADEASRAATGYMAGNGLTSLIAGIVVFVTLFILGVPFPFLWALWVALVDFLPQVGGALAGIPTVLFAATHSLTAGIVTAVVFAVYTLIENHVLNPVVMSKTVRVSPLFVLVSVLVGASIGGWLGGVFGAFVAALLAVPTAAALQTVIRELWRETAQEKSSPSGHGKLPACTCPAGDLLIPSRDWAELISNASQISKKPRTRAGRPKFTGTSARSAGSGRCCPLVGPGAGVECVNDGDFSLPDHPCGVVQRVHGVILGVGRVAVGYIGANLPLCALHAVVQLTHFRRHVGLHRLPLVLVCGLPGVAGRVRLAALSCPELLDAGRDLLAGFPACLFHGLFELIDLALQCVDVLAHCLRLANAHVSP